ncbi:MAG TPA: hypothetical protein VH257_02810 [Chloroflexota bacterium]|nr:hypothetical protein [Chloroflexota bacterium]
MVPDRPDEAALVRAASEYARRQGWNVANYRPAGCAVEQDQARVRFEGKSRLPGDHFSVVLDASTGRPLDLIPGR